MKLLLKAGQKWGVPILPGLALYMDIDIGPLNSAVLPLFVHAPNRQLRLYFFIPAQIAQVAHLMPFRWAWLQLRQSGQQ